MYPLTSLLEFLSGGPEKQRGRLGFEGDHLTYELVKTLESGLSQEQAHLNLWAGRTPATGQEQG